MKLPNDVQIERIVKKMRELGVEFGRIDIRSDGVSFYPPDQSEPENNAYATWKKQDHDRAAHS